MTAEAGVALRIFEHAIREVSGFYIDFRLPYSEGTLYRITGGLGQTHVLIEDEDSEAEGWAAAARAVENLLPNA